MLLTNPRARATLPVMAWLARLVRYAAVGLLVVLIAACTIPLLLIAVLAPVGLAFAELSERRVGLGTGICFAAVFAVIKGVLGAVVQARPTS
jgi:hypothetical protein